MRVNNGNIEEICYKCSNGFDNIIDLTDMNEYMVLSSNLSAASKTGLVYRFTNPNCELNTTTPRRPNTSDVPNFTNCENWYLFNLLGEKGCLKC